MTLFLTSHLQRMILAPDFAEKTSLAFSLTNLAHETITPLTADELIKLAQPGRPMTFNVVSPRSVPKRSLADNKSRLNFLHAIANIELLAIELPALCLLRFGANDPDFIRSQLQIIAEEAQHFLLLKNRLQELGCEFGSLPCHNGLWDHAWRCKNEIEHQIVIPCYLEARGLDVTPEFIKNLENLGDTKSAEILRIIERDEIKHVEAGQNYLQEKAKTLGLTPFSLFERTLTDFFGGNLKSKVKINRKNRLAAGFSPEMLDLLA